ncbi:MAG: ectoine hydroxylase-related dioxygenase (phytanoyl-CoA dioxygenase family) [Crocinitomix sp.]|jgi:ectoine hydroxylase-related dioxygenase (phytanoyl-CoA dioxygenase family)
MNKKPELDIKGFAVVTEVYDTTEIAQLRNILDAYCSQLDQSKPVHAIRRAIEKIPELNLILWNENIKNLISDIGGPDYFLTKAIYFDKPEESNWFVGYHQDLSISVSEKHDLNNYKNWTKKEGQIGVQPPYEILENILTLRVHLDDTNKNNGALKLIPSSHKWGIKRIQEVSTETEEICNVPTGAVMLMKPLTFHASSRSKDQKRRRVLHLEFSNIELETPLQWNEKLVV